METILIIIRVLKLERGTIYFMGIKNTAIDVQELYPQ